MINLEDQLALLKERTKVKIHDNTMAHLIYGLDYHGYESAVQFYSIIPRKYLGTMYFINNEFSYSPTFCYSDINEAPINWIKDWISSGRCKELKEMVDFFS